LRWSLAPGYEGIESAQLVVVNARDDAERGRAERLALEVARLRKDAAVFSDLVGLLGHRIPITAVAANLSDPRRRTEEGDRSRQARLAGWGGLGASPAKRDVLQGQHESHREPSPTLCLTGSESGLFRCPRNVPFRIRNGLKRSRSQRS